MCIFQKVAVLAISRNSLLAGVAGLQVTGRNTAKNKLLTKFLKVDLKISENFQEELYYGVLF